MKTNFFQLWLTPRGRRQTLAAAAAVGLATACFTGCARFKAQPLSAETSASAWENRSLADAGLKKFLETHRPGEMTVGPLATWDFTNLVLTAFYFHPDLDAARAKWNVVKAGKKIAAERPNPTASFQPGYNSTAPPPWIWGGSLDIPIETAGKRGYRMAQAKLLSNAARLNVASVAWQVRSRVRRSLLDLYAAMETQKLLENQQALQGESIKLLEAQFKAGAVSANEIAQARIGFNTSRLALLEAGRQQAEARAQLAEALGLPLAAVEHIKISFTGFQTQPQELDVSGVRRQAVVSRVDILGALAEYAASQSALQLEIAKQYPDVHLSPGYQLDQTDDKWSLGLTVTLPILNQNQGAIAEAKAKREEVATRFISVQARALAEIDKALSGYRAALPKIAAVDMLTTDLEKRQKNIQAMYAAGEITRLELIAAQQELAATQMARLDARVKTQLALGDLEDAIQSPVGWAESLWLKSPRQPELAKDKKHE